MRMEDMIDAVVMEFMPEKKTRPQRELKWWHYERMKDMIHLAGNTM